MVLCAIALYSCGSQADKTETPIAETTVTEDNTTVTLTAAQAKNIALQFLWHRGAQPVNRGKLLLKCSMIIYQKIAQMWVLVWW